MRGPCLKKSGRGEKWEPKKNWNGGVGVWGKVQNWDLEKKKEGAGY